LTLGISPQLLERTSEAPGTGGFGFRQISHELSYARQ
jgi:hypothetical protein